MNFCDHIQTLKTDNVYKGAFHVATSKSNNVGEGDAMRRCQRQAVLNDATIDHKHSRTLSRTSARAIETENMAQSAQARDSAQICSTQLQQKTFYNLVTLHISPCSHSCNKNKMLN